MQTEIITAVEWTAAVAGVLVSLLLVFFPRFGKGSWLLVLFLLPASLAAGSMAARIHGDAYVRLALSFLLIAAAGAVFACHGIDRADYAQFIRSRMRWLIPLVTPAPVLAAILPLVRRPAPEDLLMPYGHVFLGPVGYGAAVLLLILSVVALAHLEQVLRHAEEKVRWEIKFLLLGMAITLAAFVYISSKMLLYPPRFSMVAEDTLSLFPCMFLVGCVLTAISWKRSTGQSRVVVSHGLVYSSVTLLAVGVYLIASSLIARLVSRWGDIGLPIEALIFLLSAIVLAVVMLATQFRHRVRHWIRRNIFSGRYDYRRFWLEATERVRSIDPPEDAAAALADIVHSALGAIDVSVWARRWDPNRLQLLHALGTMEASLEGEVTGVVEKLFNASEPMSREDLDAGGDPGGVQEFIDRTHASLLVPLASSDRIAGVLTVGSDRSGRPYDREAREFLRALAGHAAGEFHKSDLLATLVEAKEAEAFRTFSTFMLHDLKNFASTLSLIAQNAARHRDKPDFQKDAIQSVFETAEKMKRLCNSLRSFSGPAGADKKPVDLNQIARGVADNLNAGLKQRLKLEPGTIPPVLADREDLERVLQNLMINAHEATTGDGAIILKTLYQDGVVELWIMDNGRGMSREFMETELFLPFHTTKSDGLGIGLFHSKKIMEAHGGSIHVESEEGRGTKVALRFPVRDQIREDSINGSAN